MLPLSNQRHNWATFWLTYPKQKEGFTGDTVVNPKNDTPQCMAITTRSGKVVGDMPLIIDKAMSNNVKTLSVNDDAIHDDDVEEVQNDVAPTLGNPKSVVIVKKGRVQKCYQS